MTEEVKLETYDVVEPEKPEIKPSVVSRIKEKYSEYKTEKDALKKVEEEEFQKQKAQVKIEKNIAAGEKYQKKVESAKQKAYNKTHRWEQAKRVGSKISGGVRSTANFVKRDVFPVVKSTRNFLGGMIQQQRQRPQTRTVTSYKKVGKHYRKVTRRVPSQPRQSSNLGMGRGVQFSPPKFNFGMRGSSRGGLGMKPLRFKTKRFKL